MAYSLNIICHFWNIIRKDYMFIKLADLFVYKILGFTPETSLGSALHFLFMM